MPTQYTIRAVPPAIDKTLRRLAKEQNKSLNTVALESLARGLELGTTPIKFTDLDHLIGTWQEDSAFDQAMKDFDRVDEEAWK